MLRYVLVGLEPTPFWWAQVRTGWPDWANFSPLGECFLWAVYKKIPEEPKFWATFFHGKSFVLLLAKHGLGYILGDFFHKLIWSPWARLWFRQLWFTYKQCTNSVVFSLRFILKKRVFCFDREKPSFLFVTVSIIHAVPRSQKYGSVERKRILWSVSHKLCARVGNFNNRVFLPSIKFQALLNKSSF
jgi:hypothetical protein